MIRVSTPSRLHFGLLAPFGGAGRQFGGAGLMVERPRVTVTLRPARDWSVAGPQAERAAEVLDRLRAWAGGHHLPPWPPHAVTVEEVPPPHHGLGTGTQLAMALARALCASSGREPVSAAELAEMTGRGCRSAIGVHGFAAGGFLVDGGRTADGPLAPLIAHHRIPPDWRVVLVLPPGPPGLHGTDERLIFARAAAEPAAAVAERCRLLLLGVLPALVTGDFAVFSASLDDYNRHAGEAFRAAQGGPYGEAAGEWVELIRSWGVVGVGQSSWGPGVFALAKDEDQADWLHQRLRGRTGVGPGRVIVTAGDNCGHVLS